MGSRIEPTVGRVVLYWPHRTDPLVKWTEGQPLAAHVAHLNVDGTINLMVIGMDGSSHGRKSVELVQHGYPNPDDRSFCRWMEFQIGQAAKTEAAERRLRDSLVPPTDQSYAGDIVDPEFQEAGMGSMKGNEAPDT